VRLINLLLMLICFNPRARGGRDLERRIYDEATYLVSIHAPAGGATRLTGWSKPPIRCFNPRARGGRDLAWPSILAVIS